MAVAESSNATMRSLRFHEYGEAAEVLRLDRIAVPEPAPGRVRVVVHACGLNPADWALCRGLFPGALPRGIGLEVSGVVDAVGAGDADVAVGDLVMGMADYAGAPCAGASDRAILDHWTRIPPGLDPLRAAALPMAAETAYRSLEQLDPKAGQVLMVHGAGTTVGFAAVQLALMRGARVVATAGATYAGQLREFGATVTEYGDGMVERVRAIVGGSPELILDAAPPSGVLPRPGPGRGWRPPPRPHGDRLCRRRRARRPGQPHRGAHASAPLRHARHLRSVGGGGPTHRADRPDLSPRRLESGPRDQPERARPGQARAPSRAAWQPATRADSACFARRSAGGSHPS